MRIRSTKPEFWRSKRIASVDWETRFVLKGLESYVDDNGVGKDDLELIVSDVFSRDLTREPSRTLKRVQVAVDALIEAGLVWRYVAEGNDLLYLSFWESTQYINRPSKGRFPRPDGTMDYNESKIGTPDLSPQEPSRALSAGTGEQGNRGTGRQAGATEAGEAKDDGPQNAMAILASVGLITDDLRRAYLASLKARNIEHATRYVRAQHRKGELKAEIEDWLTERDVDNVTALRPAKERHNTADDEHLKTCTRCRRMVGLEDVVQP